MSRSTEKSYGLVVSHYLLSAVFFLAMAVMLLFSVRDLQGHYFHPKLLAITHMAALGWGTLIIFGAAYQLIPVVFETELSTYRLPWISLILFISGLPLLVFSFWNFNPGNMMQTGGILLLLSVILFCITVFLTAKDNPKKASIQQKFIITSCVWLILTVLLGVLLVFNFRHPFLSKDHLHFLRLHAHMGIGGWFLLLIIGVSSRLIPMFIVSRVQNTRLLSRSYYLINLSLILFVIDTYFFGINHKTCLIFLIMLGGIILFFIYVISCFRSRIKKQIELPISNTILSFVLMVLAVALLPLIIHRHLKGDPSAVHFTTLYGSLLFMGWISALVLGQAFKTFPFIVWTRKYEQLAGKQKTPLPADLYKKNLLKCQTAAFILFCISFFTGLVVKSETLLFAGAGLLIITAAVYIINLVIVFFHRSQTTTT